MFGMIPLPVKIIAIAFVIAGAAGWGYMKGTAAGERAMLEYKANAEKQIVTLEQKNSEISGQVTTEFVENTNTIREKEIIYRDVARDMEPQYDMSNGWVYLHDAAAKLVNPDMLLASDKSPSGVMDTAALTVVISNYAICKQNAEQLTSLQKWIKENQASIDAANAKNPKEDK
jgi:hypothetical protein